MTKTDPLLNAALALIADNGWQEFTLADLARTQKANLANIHARFPTRLDVIDAFAAYLDQQTLKSLDDFTPDEDMRDRLFSVIMTRIDVLTPHKQVIRTLWQDSWKDPLLLLNGLPKGMNSMSWILQAAGIDTTGLLGSLRIKSLSIAYLRTIWTWLQDDSQTLDNTMAELDKNLLRLSHFPAFYH